MSPLYLPYISPISPYISEDLTRALGRSLAPPTQRLTHPNPNPNSNPNLNRKPYPSLPLTRAPALTASRSRARPSYLLRPCADAAAERERFGARRTLTQT